MAMSGTGFGVVGDADQLIVTMLGEAVPVLMGELLRLDGDARRERMMLWRDLSTQVVAERGDALRFGASKRGGVAQVFSAVARGVAVLACCPGGITFAGQHWCADHRLCEHAAAEAEQMIAAEVA